ncbi:MAG: hypothetical protein ACPK85_14110 [Methanosarcina sp.]
MRSKKFNLTKKAVAILLIVCFIMSVFPLLANAANNGYTDGYNKGFQDGKIQAQKDCDQYSNKEVLSKIPPSPGKSNWSQRYKNSYSKGYAQGYIDGYNGNRYTCLK